MDPRSAADHREAESRPRWEQHSQRTNANEPVPCSSSALRHSAVVIKYANTAGLPVWALSFPCSDDFRKLFSHSVIQLSQMEQQVIAVCFGEKQKEGQKKLQKRRGILFSVFVEVPLTQLSSAIRTCSVLGASSTRRARPHDAWGIRRVVTYSFAVCVGVRGARDGMLGIELGATEAVKSLKGTLRGCK